MQQKLQQLIAEGKTAQALAELRTLTDKDADLQQQVIALSARFAENERQKHAGTLDNESLGLERNRINAALLALIAQLKPSPIDGVHQTLPVNTTPTIVQNAEKIYNINHIDNANFS